MSALSKTSDLLFKSALSVALAFFGLTFGAYHDVSGQTFIGTTNSKWNTAANWSPASVPSGATTGVTLNADADINSGSDVTIGNITTSSAVTVTTSNGVNLNVGSSSNSANMTFSDGGEFDVKTTATIYGNLIITIPTSGTFTLKVSNGGILDVKGSIIISGGGSLTIDNTSTLKVAGGISGGTGSSSITNSNGGNFSVGGGISLATLTLTNKSTLSVTGGISGTANSSITNSNGGNITAGGAISLGNNSSITNTASILGGSFALGTGSCIIDSNGGTIKNTTTNQTCSSSSCAAPCSIGVTLLPITLTGFFSSLTTTSINLKWSTASELNFDYFSLQKSADGTLFNEIAQIKGHGTTNVKHDYEFEDNFPFIGKNYYRLTSVDFDNHQETFHVIVQEYKGEKDFQLSPNPSDGTSITLTFNFDESNGRLLIYDNMGSMVAVYSVNEAETISFESPLKSGIYLAKYTSPSFTKTVRFLVK